tara:strand:+ start:5368 stop:5793 length:426 start_codon:yes stop_codon:yes gene_type:complete
MNITVDIIDNNEYKDYKSNMNESNNVLNKVSNNVLNNIQDYDSDNNTLNSEIDLLDQRVALETYYELNYNLSYLNNIREYYKLKKRNHTGNLSKKQVIELIVEYEIKPESKIKVEERKRLFGYFIELKNNKYFDKFIIGNL